jgi:membrane protein DedA with SNARE-associated domain
VSEIAHLLGRLEPFVRDYGVGAVLVILTLESLGVPLPGESLLVFASLLAARGEMSFPALLLFAWIGGVIGDNIGYVIGRMLGRTLISRYGQKIGLGAERLGKIEAVFVRYGPATVGIARFFPLLRQLNGVVAGTLKMNWWTFLLFNALGCALWVAGWGLAGFYFGAHVSKITALVHHFGLSGAILLVLALSVALAYRFRRSRVGR